MTSLADHSVSTTTKLIVIGDSGVGKTGALASLAAEGYKLWLIDTDNGVDTLSTVLRDGLRYKGVDLNLVNFRTITNEFKMFGGKMISKADGWTKFQQTLTSWDQVAKPVLKPGDVVIPWVYSLGSNDIIVVDSLTGLANLAMDAVLSIQGRLGSTPHQGDWRDGQDYIKNALRLLTAEQVKANLIINAHIEYIKTEETEAERGYPATLGRALSPKIGAFFNSVLYLKRHGVGSTAKREFFTEPQGVVEVKNSAPFSVKKTYSIETGLADFFRDVRGTKVETPKLVEVKK